MSAATQSAMSGISAPLVAHVFPSFAVGGAQVRFAALANHFGAEFRHIVVALDGDAGCRDRLDPKLDIEFPSVAAPKHAMLANAWRFRSRTSMKSPRLIDKVTAHGVLVSRSGQLVHTGGRPRMRVSYGAAAEARLKRD